MPPTAPTIAPRPAAARPPGSAAPGVPGLTIDPRKLLLQYWPWLVGALVAGVVLGVVTHFVIRFTYPLYNGDVVFEMLPSLEKADQGNQTVSSAGGEAEMKRFIGTQIQIITSDNIIEKAVNDPRVKVDTQWIKEFMANGIVDTKKAAKELADIVSARQIPESNLVLLRVRTTKSRDVAVLANALKEVYMNNLKQATVKDNQDLLESMNRRLNSLKEERGLLEDRKANYIGGSNKIETLEDRMSYFTQQLDKLLPVKVGTKYQLDLQQSLLDQYEEQLRAPGGPTYPERVRKEIDEHPIVQRLEEAVSNLKATRRAMLEKLGPNHAYVRQIENTISGTAAQLEEERARLMREAFNKMVDQTRSDIRSLQSTLAETDKDIEQARTGQADVTALMEKYKTAEEDSKRIADSMQDLQERINEQNNIMARKASSRVRVYADADIPDRPAFPIIWVVVPLVALLCVGGVAGVIVLREALEQRVRGPADVALVPRVRVLGVIPDLSEDPSAPESAETAVRDRPSGVTAECVRQIRTETLKWLARRDSAAILVTAGMPGSGATTVITNVAYSCAAAERRVLIIDANLRRPRMHAVFDLPEGPGLGDVLHDKLTLKEAIRHSSQPGLDVVTAGATDFRSFERLTTEKMARLIDEARAAYDVVLIDAPPTIVSGDAVILTHRCDGVVLVVRAFSEKRGLVARMRNQFEEAKADFLGVIVNGVRSSAGGYFRRNFRATHEYQNNGLFADAASAGKRGRGGRLAAADEQPPPTKRNGELDRDKLPTDGGAET